MNIVSFIRAMTSRNPQPVRTFLPLLLLMSMPAILSAQIDVILPEVNARPGAEISIPLKIGELEGEKVTSFEFVVSCDTNLVQLLGVDQAGTLSEGLTMFANNHVAPFGRGRMKVVCASAIPLSGNGVLVKILALARGRNGKAALKLSDFILNAGKPTVETTAGVVMIRRSRKN
ncbi:MAG TPA: hypothetical protein DEP53_09745 [Bacteroidetes bacterium]|nr:hypothetical protein [Bacteroidota bacterium]